MKLSRWTIRNLPAGLLASVLLRAGAARAEGMPQLDFTTPLTISQVFWGGIIFYFLYRILARNGLPLVESVLTERAGNIGRDLDSAKVAKTSADAGIEAAVAATAKARAEAQAAVNAALEDAKKAAATQAEALNARLEARLHDAEAQIAQARAEALGALRQVATETTITVVTRLIGAAPDAARLEGAVGSALSARGIG